MNIDEETKKAIETVAKAKVAEALGGDVLGKLVDEVMRHTNRTYGSDTSTFFDRIVRECIEATIRQAAMAAISDNEAVKEKIASAIRERADHFAVTIVDAFADNDWRAELKVTVNRGD
jgi:phage baseplate assembly protein W